MPTSRFTKQPPRLEVRWLKSPPANASIFLTYENASHRKWLVTVDCTPGDIYAFLTQLDRDASERTEKDLISCADSWVCTRDRTARGET